ncbi:putative F-box domain-containing protein [Tanacetum coccineum]
MVVFDIVEEILLRCLVTDLLRYKSVCKSWYSLISSPFVETHCKFMCNKEDINTRRIAMIPPELGSYNIWSMEGSSNGLVCIYYTGYEDRIIVTNPLTRQFRELAKPPDFPGRALYMRCMGFGYDSSTDDYKVVRAIRNSDITLVHIISLRSNIWKLFRQINFRSRADTPGVLFNEALHWFWFDANQKASIVSFNLAKEEFREIPQPDDSRYVWNYDYSLGTIEGSLCIFIKKSYYVNDHPPCSIWVMKNYNGKPSWELLAIKNYCEMKDHAIHYMFKDTNQYRKTPPHPYFCNDNIRMSRSEEYISSPIFVQSANPCISLC